MTHWEGGCLHQLAVGKICGSFAPGSALKSHGSGNKRMTNHECGSKHQESNKVNSKAGCLVLDLFVCLNSWSGCICTFWRWIFHIILLFQWVSFQVMVQIFFVGWVVFWLDNRWSHVLCGESAQDCYTDLWRAVASCGKLIKVWPNSSLSASTSSPSLLLSSLNHSPVACGLILRETFLQQDFWYNTCDWFCLLAYLAKITITWGRLLGYRKSLSLLSLSSLSLSFL